MESCKHTQKDLISCMLMLGQHTLKRAMLRLLRWRIQKIIATILTALRWAELWRRGSVVGSWLLTLLRMYYGQRLNKFDGGVSDSGEGRWTVHAAVDLAYPLLLFLRRCLSVLNLVVYAFAFNGSQWNEVYVRGHNVR